MKKNFRNILYMGALLLLIGTGCTKFKDLELNPNQPTQSVPSLIFTGVEADAFQFNPILGYETRASQYLVSDNSQQADQSYQWDTTEYWRYYNTLRNVEQMRIEAERTSAPIYGIMAKFFKAYCFAELSKQVGDIPMSQALEGKSGDYTPAYDSQETVMDSCLMLLDQANTGIRSLIQSGNAPVLSGDIIYNGDLMKWQKLFNSYRLRLLIDLSKKVNDNVLNVKSQFSTIFNNPGQYPIFTSNSDGAVFQWYDKDGDRYPRYYVPANMDYYRFGSTYTQYLTAFDDPRIMVVGVMTQTAAAAGKQPSDITAYNGLSSGLSISDIYNKKDSASALNVARYSTATGEPMIIVGYPELCFNIAEAINRGWISGDANAFYQNGIRASMQFYQQTGGQITDGQISAYLAQSQVQYNGDLNNILIQKYLSFFNNSGWESYYNILRTGVPVLAVGPGNGNNDKIPDRWMYPQTEYAYNAQNVRAAIQRQFGGSDDRNGVLWIYQ